MKNYIEILFGKFQERGIRYFLRIKRVRYRFPEEYHKDLLKIAWWDWDTEKVKRTLNNFELDVQDFINKHK